MFLLASQSPRRRQLLAEAGVAFGTDVSRGEEAPWDGHQSPQDYTRGLAEAKTLEVSRRHPGMLTLGADTVVALDGRIYGKPRDLDDARRMFRTFSGREHQVITGVAFANDGALLESWNAVTAVRFKDLSADNIEEYLRLVNVLDKAGAYGIQEHGELIVQGIQGSYSNVVGLPVEEVLAALQRLGK